MIRILRLKTELSQQKTAKGFLNLFYFECGSNHDFGQKNSGPYFVFLDFLLPDQVGSHLSKDARSKRYCRECINKVLQLQNSHYGRRVLKTLNYVSRENIWILSFSVALARKKILA